MTNHHTFRPPRLTRGQQILIAKPVKVTPAAELARRKDAAGTSQMRDRRRGYGRLR